MECSCGNPISRTTLMECERANASPKCGECLSVDRIFRYEEVEHASFSTDLRAVRARQRRGLKRLVKLIDRQLRRAA